MKWTKTRSPVSKKAEEIDNKFIDIDLTVQNSDLKEYSLVYVAGYIVRKMTNSLVCESCASALITESTKQQYLSLVAMKDRGGLIYASKEVVKILC